MMRLFALLVLVSTPSMAADELRLALALKAQAEFDRVDLAGVARLEDAGACVQSQAAALAVALPADAALLHYRKGFCLLAGAAITHRAEEYGAAEVELEKAIEAWPARLPSAGSKKGAPEPVSPGLRVLATIARLQAGLDAAGSGTAGSGTAGSGAAGLGAAASGTAGAGTAGLGAATSGTARQGATGAGAVGAGAAASGIAGAGTAGLGAAASGAAALGAAASGAAGAGAVGVGAATSSAAGRSGAGADTAAPDTARLERARLDLAAAAATPICALDVMPAVFCQQIVQKGRDWLGWMALNSSDPREAARDFVGSTGGWVDWVAGRQAFAEGRYQPAAGRYQAAIARWEIDRRESPPNILQSLSPRPDWAESLADLGGAQLLAGEPAAAIATLDRAAHEDGSRARPLYLRARAKEAAGDPAGALTDYNLASRTAFASAKDLASGEAHFYRGILLYRRKEWARAEDEFSSALNFEIPAVLHADAQAWRHLAAVAGGSCAASREYLERSLEAVSPYFPKAEARALAASCPAMNAAGRRGDPAN
ncbi:MAG: tetratricopeptide repeat protein [Bryobacteraceae bacterium]